MEIVIKKQNGVNVVSSRVVAEQLGKRHADVLSKIKEVLNERGRSSVDYKDAKGEKRPEFLLTKDDLKMLLSRYRHITPEQYKVLGIDEIDVVHSYTRFETAFGNTLIEALNELEIEVEKQFNVDGYRVDFYIPHLNIAVEYDEEQHFTETNLSKDTERQSYIENKLGCKFIRCDYRNSDIKNVMKVLKEVM